jgi:hypothetical protein
LLALEALSVEQTLATKQKEQKFTKQKREQESLLYSLLSGRLFSQPPPPHPPECVHLQVAPLEAREVCSMPEALLFLFFKHAKKCCQKKNCSMREVLFKKDSLQHARVAVEKRGGGSMAQVLSHVSQVTARVLY